MKKRERFFQKDSSNQSVSILRNKVQEYLLHQFQIQDAWFCDYYLPHRDNSYDQVLDIVFFGNFLKKFLEGSLWPFDQYRFWVLSNASKETMANLIGIPKDSIAVVPRYDLFSKSTLELPFDIKKIEHIYYVGQLRSEKNIYLSLWLIYFLQKKYHFNIEFNIVGDFYLGDDHIEEERANFKNNCLSLINELDWIIKPKFHGPIENFSWEKKSDNIALINLSTFMHDDFSLAQAYAHENNWYSIVSQWGGFLDITGHSCIKIPHQMIGDSNESVLESKIRAISIAQFLFEANMAAPNKELQKSSTEIPKTISNLELIEIRKNFVKKWGPSLYHVFTNMNLVLDSQKGITLYEEYKNSFSQNSHSFKKIILINELDEKIYDLESRILKLPISHDTIFIQIKDLRYKKILQKTLNVEEIFIPDELKNSTLLSLLHNIADKKITTY